MTTPPPPPEGSHDFDSWVRAARLHWAAGRAVEATEAFRAALAHRKDGDALNELGVLLIQQGLLKDAIRAFQEHLVLRPNSPSGQNNLGLAFLDAGRPADAESAFREAARLNPGDPDAHNCLGVALLQQDKLDEAVLTFQHVVRLKPDHPEAHINLGLVRRRLKNPAVALGHFRSAVELDPGRVEALTGVGLSLIDLDRLEEAEPMLRRALGLAPGLAGAHRNLGVLLADLGRVSEGLAHLATAAELNPNDPEVHQNYALKLLAAGDWKRGWVEYEWRRRLPGGTPGDLPPRWDGTPLGGRTLLVWAEQGIGDTLHFVRFLPEVRRRFGGRVVLACQPSIVRLLRQSPLAIDQVVPAGEAVAADVSIGLLSLPGLLGVTPDTVPASVPYLAADPAAVERWRAHLQHVGGFRLGIAWQGSAGYQGDRYRSFPLAHFATLAAVPGVQLISLQKEFGAEQLGPASDRVVPLDLGRQVDESGGYLDTAAVLQSLDLVITPDTSLVHLAGGLGVPAWLPLSVCCDWRWLKGRADTPWYPTVRLFRQTTRGDWEGVFACMADALRAAVAEWSARRPLLAELSAAEVVDKVVILEIKLERVVDPAERGHIETELAALRPPYARLTQQFPSVAELAEELRRVNEVVWGAEVEVRECEQAGEFGAEFIQAARSVYQQNDRRAAIKRHINELTRSRFREVKHYSGTV